jgi:hypothetical protein
MENTRYMQILESRIVGDKTILDDLVNILNKHGKFQVVRDSLVITIIENPLWIPKNKPILPIAPIRGVSINDKQKEGVINDSKSN